MPSVLHILLAIVLATIKGEVHVYTQIPGGATGWRLREYLYCLERNLANEQIDGLTLIGGHRPSFTHARLHFVPVDFDLTLAYAVRFARLNNTNSIEKRRRAIQVAVVANADIVFDASIGNARYVAGGLLLLLSRHELINNARAGGNLGCQCQADLYVGSHDVLVVSIQETRSAHFYEHILNYALGTPGMEARIVHDLRTNYPSELVLLNPCWWIRPWHVHTQGQLRPYRHGRAVNDRGRSQLLWPM
jgi:hypothetical protein